MQRLNPAAKDLRAAAEKATTAAQKARADRLKQKRSKAGRKEKSTRTARFNGLKQGLEEAFEEADRKVQEELLAGLYKVEGDDDEEDDE